MCGNSWLRLAKPTPAWGWRNWSNPPWKNILCRDGTDFCSPFILQSYKGAVPYGCWNCHWTRHRLPETSRWYPYTWGFPDHRRHWIGKWVRITLNVASLNVRELRDSRKCARLLSELLNQCVDVATVQDTHFPCKLVECSLNAIVNLVFTDDGGRLVVTDVAVKAMLPNVVVSLGVKHRSPASGVRPFVTLAAQLVAEGGSLSMELSARFGFPEQFQVLAHLAACPERVAPCRLGFQSVLDTQARMPPLRQWFGRNGFAGLLLLVGLPVLEPRRWVDAARR